MLLIRMKKVGTSNYFNFLDLNERGGHCSCFKDYISHQYNIIYIETKMRANTPCMTRLKNRILKCSIPWFLQIACAWVIPVSHVKVSCYTLTFIEQFIFNPSKISKTSKSSSTPAPKIWACIYLCLSHLTYNVNYFPHVIFKMKHWTLKSYRLFECQTLGPIIMANW
jgi:hypothetical protein